MFIKLTLIIPIVIALLLSDVESKTCKRIETVSKMVEVTYTLSYRQSYHGHCYYGCIKSRWATRVLRKTTPTFEKKVVKYCCSGYMRTDESPDNSDIVCEPICMPACKNGHCTAPGECACNIGFEQDPNDSRNCLPTCENGCDHGTCISPNTCRCDFGYTITSNTTCQPICTEVCHNGTCISPETCECLPGFRETEKNRCQPFCSNGCENGSCTAPEVCTCNSGWHMTESEDPLNKTCKPICSNPCGNGACVAPETCNCRPGYRTSDNNICEPECKYSCGSGTCVRPNECSCFPGYRIDIRRLLGHIEGPLCIPSCSNCKGICVAPNKCIIEEISTTNSEDLCENCTSVASLNTTSTSPPTTTDNYKDYNDTYESENRTYDYDPMIYNNSVNSTPTEAGDKDGNNTLSSNINGKSMHNSWIQQHWISIFIPIMVIVTAGIVMLLVCRWTPVIYVFKSRSYVVQGDPLEHMPHPFEDIQMSSPETKGAKM